MNELNRIETVDFDGTISESANTDKRLLISVIIGFVLVVLGVIIHPVMYIAAAYMLIVIFFSKSNEDIVCMLFAWMNMATIFKLSSSSSSLFTYIEIITTIILLIRRKKINIKFLLTWIFFVAYLLINVGSNYSTFIKIILVPMLLHLLTRDVSYEGLKKLSAYYVLGVIIQSMLGYYRNSIPNLSNFINYKVANTSYSYGIGYIKESRFSGLSGDPNYYTVFLILALSMCMVFFARHEIKSKTFYLIYGAIVFFGGLTGSRTFILMLAVATFLLTVVLFGEHEYRKMAFFVAAVIIALILVFTGLIDIFSLISKRINLGNLDLTTGRADIWKNYLNMFQSDFRFLLFGNGIGKGYPNRVAHNYYLDSLIICGIAGSVIYITTLYFAVKGGSRHRDFASVIPAIMIGIMYFSLSMFFQYELTFQLAGAALFLNVTQAVEQ